MVLVKVRDAFRVKRKLFNAKGYGDIIEKGRDKITMNEVRSTFCMSRSVP